MTVLCAVKVKASIHSLSSTNQIRVASSLFQAGCDLVCRRCYLNHLRKPSSRQSMHESPVLSPHRQNALGLVIIAPEPIISAHSQQRQFHRHHKSDIAGPCTGNGISRHRMDSSRKDFHHRLEYMKLHKGQTPQTGRTRRQSCYSRLIVQLGF
jgi:hypothetical protein